MSADADKAVLAQTTLVSDIWVATENNADDAKPITPAIDRFCWLNDERIVFRSYSTGGSDIWTMKADGTEQKQLTSNTRVNRSPTASPDGRYIVFESNRSGKFHIWRMDSDGNNQIQITDSQGEYNPTVSSDGLWIFYNTVGDRYLWKMPIEGGEATQVIDKFSVAPAISLDNKQIAFIELDDKHKYKIVLTSLDGKGDKKEFVNSKYRISVLRLQWSLDGNEIFYVAE